MRLLLFLLFSSLALAQVSATAAGNQCANVPELVKRDLTGCVCGKELSGVPVTAPKGMSLIAACGYKKVEFVGAVGKFFFSGNATVHGTIRHKRNDDGSEVAMFEARNSGGDSQFRNATDTMRFEHDEATAILFKLPAVDEDTPCWQADTTLRVKQLYVRAGFSADEEGSWPNAFEVEQLGKYQECPEDDS